MALRIVTLLLILMSSLFAPASQASLFRQPNNPGYAPVDQAFSFDFRQQGAKLTLRWQIKPGYYLYRQQLNVVANGVRLAEWHPPQGEAHHDEFYGETVIYTSDLSLPLTLLEAGKNATLTFSYQGCAAAGFCYPPESRTIPVNEVLATSPPPAATTSPKSTVPDTQPFSPLWALLIGLGIAFTPCVLPMYPLIAGVILGQRQRFTLRRTALLTLVYIQGMALTYTLLGIVVAAAGLQFQAALQSPLVLGTLSVIFILLALSMFGFFNLQLPSALQTTLTLWSNRRQSGSFPGVFLMGGVAGLICSPCTTAPLSAILLYIAQSGNMAIGAGTLYLYALGMGFPLLLVTLSGQRLLPKSGPWMQTIKEGFGFVILALPIFLLERVFGDKWGVLAWSALAVAFFAWGAITIQASSGKKRLVKILLMAGAIISAGPLQQGIFNTSSPAIPSSGTHFTPVRDLAELQQARMSGKISMLDLYAEWCVACKEFEKYTFSDPQVQALLTGVTTLQADVTQNNPRNRDLLNELHVLGLPTLIFFDEKGNEIPDSRVTGFMDAPQFQQHLQTILR
ncbi:MAG: Thiol:disulfide interchange protein DsbD [Candidatus Erwinia impunctatus]|nr:Thiol:disulfide interchange protein DsbD [Culicoides impunctatus]